MVLLFSSLKSTHNLSSQSFLCTHTTGKEYDDVDFLIQFDSEDLPQMLLLQSTRSVELHCMSSTPACCQMV